MQAIRYEAEVADDHRIHLDTPDLPCGTVLELIALIKYRPFEAKTDWSSRMGQYPRVHYGRLETVSDVAQYVQSLREDRDVG
jgi:hypothetical protein